MHTSLLIHIQHMHMELKNSQLFAAAVDMEIL